jgi:hypothetical protein
MTSHNRQRRSSSPTATFTALEPGERRQHNRQLSVGDAASATLGLPLLARGPDFDPRAYTPRTITSFTQVFPTELKPPQRPVSIRRSGMLLPDK